MALGAAVNVAVTEAALVMVNEQFLAEWVQLPLQPPKVDKALGDARRFTTVPAEKLPCAQLPPETQVMLPLTVPPPLPVMASVRGYCSVVVAAMVVTVNAPDTAPIVRMAFTVVE